MIPNQLLPFFHPAIRPVYMNGMPIDPSAEAAADLEIEQLQAKMASMEAACSSAEAKVEELRDLLNAEKDKTRQLEHGNSVLRTRVANAEATAEQHRRTAQFERERAVSILFDLPGGSPVSPTGVTTSSCGYAQNQNQ